MTTPRSLFGMFEHSLFRASAGTGKTYQLSNRFLELLFSDVPPEDILATTFTRKAAGEILSRVLLRLAEAAADASKREELRKAIRLPKLSEERCRKLLLATLKNLHRLRVSTLDAFFLQVAGAYGWELNFPPGWSISDNLQDERLRDDAIDEVLNEGEFSQLRNLFHLLTKGESARAMAELVAETVEGLYSIYQESQADAWQKINAPDRVSAERLGEALRTLQNFPAAGKQFTNAITADAERVVQQNWLKFLTTGIAKKLVEKETEFSRKPIPVELATAYQPLLQHALAELIGRLADQTRATHELLAHFDAAYEQRKDAQRLLRFDDVTRRLAQATSLPADGASFRMNGRIEHLLLDEFQDTSLAQWQVLRPLVRQAAEKGSLFVVGDRKQAIYGWRGGLAEIFDAVAGEIPKLTARTLSESYRSAPVIMDVVNLVFQNLTKHPRLEALAPAVTAWERDFPPHSTALHDLPGYADLQVSPAVSEDQDKQEIHYQFVAEQIAAAVKHKPGRSIGVLCRRNITVARIIYLLRRLEVPASEEGGNPLDDSAPVEVILSVLKLMDHPGDSVAAFHVAHSPLAEFLGLKKWKSRALLAARAAELRRELMEQGYGPLVLRWARQLAPVCNERDRNRLQQLVEQAHDYQTQSTLRTTDFIAAVRGAKISDPMPVDVRVMTIHQAKGLEFDIVFLPEMSEKLRGQPPRFVVGRPGPTEPVDVVCRYTPAEIQELLPPALQQLFARSLEQQVTQSLCMLYVALTRAIHALHIIIPPSSSKGTLSADIASLLRVTMMNGEPAMPGTTPFCLGNPDWVQQAKPASKLQIEEPLPTKIQLAPLVGQRKRSWQRVAPSQLEGLGAEEDASSSTSLEETLRPQPSEIKSPLAATGPRVQWTDLFGLETNFAMARGTLFHAWYEQIEWLDDGLPGRPLLEQTAQRLAGSLGIVAGQALSLQEGFCETLARPNLSSLLRKSAYSIPAGGKLVVEREFPFAIRCGSDLVQGVIDRLVLTTVSDKVVAAQIVDFKTDSVPQGNVAALQARVDFYRPQLAAYAKAVQLLFRLPAEAVSQRLAFVGCDAVVSLP